MTTIDDVPEHIKTMFLTLVLEMRMSGQYSIASSRSILCVFRSNGHECNDHWSPALARWVVEQYPELNGFFEMRESECDPPDDRQIRFDF